MRIFVYKVVINSGYAPCIQGGICTLNICKPAMRRTAEVGDIVIGIMSQSQDIRAGVRTHFGGRDIHITENVDEYNLPKSGNGTFKIVYAMQITDVVTMQEYDQIVGDRRMDSIYDFRNRIIRPGPHGSSQQATDLSGLNTLISEYFVYYGRHAPQLDENLVALLPKLKIPRLHAVFAGNSAFGQAFEEWLDMRVSQISMSAFEHDHFLILSPNAIIEPQEMIDDNNNDNAADDDEEDEDD